MLIDNTVHANGIIYGRLEAQKYHRLLFLSRCDVSQSSRENQTVSSTTGMVTFTVSEIPA